MTFYVLQATYKSQTCHYIIVEVLPVTLTSQFRIVASEGLIMGFIFLILLFFFFLIYFLLNVWMKYDLGMFFDRLCEIVLLNVGTLWTFTICTSRAGISPCHPIPLLSLLSSPPLNFFPWDAWLLHMINWLNMQSKASTHCTAQSHSWSSEESKAFFSSTLPGSSEEK